MKYREEIKRKQKKIKDKFDKRKLKDEEKPKRVKRERKNIPKMHREKG
jgi:hypothetical protein